MRTVKELVLFKNDFPHTVLLSTFCVVDFTVHEKVVNILIEEIEGLNPCRYQFQMSSNLHGKTMVQGARLMGKDSNGIFYTYYPANTTEGNRSVIETDTLTDLISENNTLRKLNEKLANTNNGLIAEVNKRDEQIETLRTTMSMQEVDLDKLQVIAANNKEGIEALQQERERLLESLRRERIDHQELKDKYKELEEIRSKVNQFINIFK